MPPMYEQKRTFSTAGELLLKQSSFSEMENSLLLVGLEPTTSWLHAAYSEQSGRSPKVVAHFSATNFSSYTIELLQLYGRIQIKRNYGWIHNNIVIRSHLMI